MIDMYEVTMKLIGPIDPVGDIHVDDERFENLKNLTELTNRLIGEIDIINHIHSLDHRDRVKRAANHCSDFFDDLGITD